MIRLTRQADYAILLLARMATWEGGSVHAAPELSSETGVPVPMVSKILKRLARAGLLASHRGARGGYSFARQPDEMTVAEILTAIEGPIGMTACTDGRTNDCDLESRCSVHHAWRALNEAVVGALSRVTLADMVSPPPQARQLVTVDLGPSHAARTQGGER